MTQAARPLDKADAREAFIAAMRRVASSVTVVTTAGDGGRHGATVSAFCSVSADPPAMLICLRAESRIAAAVTENRVFCVNVLPQRHQQIADRFAGRHDHQVADRFEGVACEAVSMPAPALTGATVFCCMLVETIRSGSHRIFIGDVLETRAGALSPLAYLDGAYQRVVPQREAAQ